jgi:hypothetical protein
VPERFRLYAWQFRTILQLARFGAMRWHLQLLRRNIARRSWLYS